MKLALLLLIALVTASVAGAQTFTVDTIRFHGAADHHVNIVILGDGYTESEQATFHQDAARLSNYLLTTSPWDRYASYFNVFAIGVASEESGTSHPNTASDCAGSNVPLTAVNTYFGCTFDAAGIHRLVVPRNTRAISQVLAEAFPDYDLVLMLANTPFYGGSGGSEATATLNTSSAEIVAHEIGHSFGKLADEYWAGPQYAAEKPNMTRESDASIIKWANWLTVGTGVGIYPHTGDASWFKPSESCKMQALGNPYCAVCSEAIIEQIHQLVNPIVAYHPLAISTELTSNAVTFRLDNVIGPTPNTLRFSWMLDGEQIANATDSLIVNPASLTLGEHTLEVSVLDTTSLVRTDDHFTEHISRVTWSINKTESLVASASSERISLSVFPNPTASDITIMATCERPQQISVAIVSSNGNVVWRGESTGAAVEFTRKLSLKDMATGAYTVIYRIGNVTETGRFIKQ